MNRTTRKIVTLGETGVGKSSLICRVINDNFYEFQEPTIGAAFQVKEIELENTKVKLEIWDTAGQERYKSLAPMYYRGATVALICFDLGNPDSLKTALEWNREILTNGMTDCCRFLVGTKADCDRIVENGAAVAGKEGMIYMETSAKNSKNVDKLFKAVAKYGITVNNHPKEQERYERTCTPCQYDQNNRTYECCF